MRGRWGRPPERGLGAAPAIRGAFPAGMRSRRCDGAPLGSRYLGTRLLRWIRITGVVLLCSVAASDAARANVPPDAGVATPAKTAEAGRRDAWPWSWSREERTPRIDCTTHVTRGSRQGKAIRVPIVHVDGVPMARATANAFWAMREAAAADGIDLRVRSGFRTREQQAFLYRCYRTCSCNHCTLAARPGYSRHESGSALDLVLADPEVHPWLERHANRFGFRATVRREPWHWEYRGSSRRRGICSAGTPIAERIDGDAARQVG